MPSLILNHRPGAKKPVRAVAKLCTAGGLKLDLSARRFGRQLLAVLKYGCYEPVILGQATAFHTAILADLRLLKRYFPTLSTVLITTTTNYIDY